MIQVGDRFGMLVVIAEAARSRTGERRWVCRCDCGEQRTSQGGNLAVSGERASCGCSRRTFEPHQRSEHICWQHMKDRCTNANSHAFHHYGGRGIQLCDRWRDFQTFYRDMGPRPSPQHSLDRIDVNGHYEPGNVRWADHDVQGNNRRNCHYVTHDGETLTVAQWSVRTGIGRTTIDARLSRGWATDRTLTTPGRS